MYATYYSGILSRFMASIGLWRIAFAGPAVPIYSIYTDVLQAGFHEGGERFQVLSCLTDAGTVLELGTPSHIENGVEYSCMDDEPMFEGFALRCSSLTHICISAHPVLPKKPIQALVRRYPSTRARITRTAPTTSPLATF